jgi:hypothetical protein
MREFEWHSAFSDHETSAIQFIITTALQPGQTIRKRTPNITFLSLRKQKENKVLSIHYFDPITSFVIRD